MIPVRKALGFHKVLFKMPFINFVNTIINIVIIYYNNSYQL